MNNSEFDAALIAAALTLAGDRGWRHVTVAAAARAAELPLSRARVRFPSRQRILMRLGELADEAVLAEVPDEGTVRDRLFDLLMRRFDAFQAHRQGIVAILHALPFDPPLALLLACATRRSMRWMLEAAGVSGHGCLGEAQVRGLVGVWLWGLRAWEKDDSEDLTATMAAVDTALARAERVMAWLGGSGGRAETVDPAGDDDAVDDAALPAEDPEPSAPA